jgi:hypothetical protein
VAALSLIGALSPDEAVELLRSRLGRLAEQRAEFRTSIDIAVASGLLFQVEEEYRLALLKADSAFVEDLIIRITDPETGWRPLWAQFTPAGPLPKGGTRRDSCPQRPDHRRRHSRPAAAMALQMAGIEPAIYEAQPAAAEEAGAFLTVATRPETVDRRQVKHELGTLTGGPHRGAVADISRDPLRGDTAQPALVRAWLHHGDDPCPPGLHRPCDGGPDEPRGAGNDHPGAALD